MQYIFIHYPKCTTCKRAKKLLEEWGVDYIDRNIITETPTYEELLKWHQMSGIPLKKFFNTSGLIYKSMHLKDRIAFMSEEELLRLLSSNGMLIKRPLLIGNKILIGFKEEEYRSLLG